MFHIYRKGTVSLVCAGILLLAAALSPLVAAKFAPRRRVRAVFGKAANAVAIASVVLTCVLGVYGTNCMVVGGCDTLSWVYVGGLAIAANGSRQFPTEVILTSSRNTATTNFGSMITSQTASTGSDEI